MPPIIAIHLSAALSALALGPIALWARLGKTRHPRLHRAAGYAWISMMLASAISAMFIRDFVLPNLAGFTPIHILVPVTLVGLGFAVWAVATQRYALHKISMQTLYWTACVVPGLFALLPSRFLGRLLWAS